MKKRKAANKKNKSDILIPTIALIMLILISLVYSYFNEQKGNPDCRITNITAPDEYSQPSNKSIYVKVEISNFGDGNCEVDEIYTNDLKTENQALTELKFSTNPSVIKPAATKEYVLTGEPCTKTSDGKQKVEVKIYIKNQGYIEKELII